VTALLRYTALALGGTAVVAGLLWPLLAPAGRSGVLVAAAIALPVQLASFAFLVRFRGTPNGFLAGWVGGTLVRFTAVLGATVFALRGPSEQSVPMLLALAGFFFGLLLLEPLAFRSGNVASLEVR